MNERFQNVVQGKPNKTPPIWFMRQAGRYHKHYQNLRAKHSFLELCRNPDLAAQVARGPVEDFDFDLAILFSDILFPLDALGMGLDFTDKGPHLDWHFTGDFSQFASNDLGKEKLIFQGQAVAATRAVLPKDKSLIGFVGAPWTLFVYACEGSHAGSLTASKALLTKFPQFLGHLLPLLEFSISQQLAAGAEVVFLFDTAAGELSPALYQKYVLPSLLLLAGKYPKKLAYYSKGTNPNFFPESFFQAPWVGMGFDHRWNLPQLLADQPRHFVQGNFDQSLLFSSPHDFREHLAAYLAPFKQLDSAQRSHWVSGLGHGVLPKTPEDHVRLLIDTVRKEFS